jgi:hypothetical protein
MGLASSESLRLGQNGREAADLGSLRSWRPPLESEATAPRRWHPSGASPAFAPVRARASCASWPVQLCNKKKPVSSIELLSGWIR